tara:strand:- start:1 stop:111 length:111 start_codon:yes stop_codon:yes gene_type:complete
MTSCGSGFNSDGKGGCKPIRMTTTQLRAMINNGATR